LELTLEFSGLIFLVLISGSLDTKRLHHSILLICEKEDTQGVGRAHSDQNPSRTKLSHPQKPEAKLQISIIRVREKCSIPKERKVKRKDIPAWRKSKSMGTEGQVSGS
jgi:hypothetical protein